VDRIWVLKFASDYSFRPEPLVELVAIGELAIDELDGADFIEGQVAHLVNRGHSPRPDLLQDLVLVADHHSRQQLRAAAERAPVFGATLEVGRVDSLAVGAILHIPALIASCE